MYSETGIRYSYNVTHGIALLLYWYPDEVIWACGIYFLYLICETSSDRGLIIALHSDSFDSF
jgi:hypothetical protein